MVRFGRDVSTFNLSLQSKTKTHMVYRPGLWQAASVSTCRERCRDKDQICNPKWCELVAALHELVKNLVRNQGHSKNFFLGCWTSWAGGEQSRL